MSFKKYWVACFIVFVSSPCLALPQYALQYGINDCTACHISPVGGGLRNSNGKVYGDHGYPVGPFGAQDLVSADVRTLYFYAKKESSTADGMGLMAVNVGANVPVTKLHKGAPGTRLVITQNIGGFTGPNGTPGTGGPRETYVRWKFARDTSHTILPKYLLIGRVEAPFGIMTDEHRTYVNMQTQTTWRDMDMGALFSGDLSTLHYDWAVDNGVKTMGASLSNDNAALWGTTLNLRWMPHKLPFALGASGSYYARQHLPATSTSTYKDPNAEAYYAMLSLDRLTNNFVSGSILAEYVRARYWNENPDIAEFFNTTYQQAVLFDESVGWMGEVNWNLSQKFTLIYKLDYLDLNAQYPSDAYVRNGFGFRYVMGPNIIGQLRYETATAGQPLDADGASLGAQGDVFALLQISI